MKNSNFPDLTGTSYEAASPIKPSQQSLTSIASGDVRGSQLFSPPIQPASKYQSRFVRPIYESKSSLAGLDLDSTKQPPAYV